MEKKLRNRKSQIEILEAVVSSNSIGEVLKKLYTTKPSGTMYRNVSKLMIETGVRFKNGEVYIHKSLEEMYNELKDKKSEFVK